VTEARIESANMSELVERVSRTRTAIGNWLDVDDALVGEEFPDAQLLRDRLNVASHRWPSAESLPARVVQLSQAVEEYYETGENARERIL
jgi:elongation factor P hydroxylase